MQERLSAGAPLEQRIELLLEGVQAVDGVCPGDELDVFLGKIHARLDQAEQVHQIRLECLVASPQCAAQQALRGSQLKGVRARDDLIDCLGLHQIEFAVEIGATGKLPRGGVSQTVTDQV